MGGAYESSIRPRWRVPGPIRCPGVPGSQEREVEDAPSRRCNIVLTGFMGTGKTTVALHAVANVLGPKGEMTADPAEAVATLVAGLAQGVRQARLAGAE